MSTVIFMIAKDQWNSCVLIIINTITPTREAGRRERLGLRTEASDA